MFFMAKLILVPILFVFVMLMVIREQVEYLKDKSSGKKTSVRK